MFLYLNIADGWGVELQTGLLLSASVPVETLQEEVVDRQPLAGRQLRGELKCVELQPAQFVGAEDVQPRRVHVKCAWRTHRKTAMLSRRLQAGKLTVVESQHHYSGGKERLLLPSHF